MERWPGSRTGDFLEDGKGVPGRGRRDLDGDLNPGQGDFLTGVCRDEKVLGLRHNGLQLRGWPALGCRLSRVRWYDAPPALADVQRLFAYAQVATHCSNGDVSRQPERLAPPVPSSFMVCSIVLGFSQTMMALRL